jgi:hypothetical protein
MQEPINLCDLQGFKFAGLRFTRDVRGIGFAQIECRQCAWFSRGGGFAEKK